MLEQLSHQDFIPHLNTIFTIHYGENETFQAELAEVSTLGDEPKNAAQRWSFALVFQVAGNEQYLVQQIYPVSHPILGQMEVFIVPLGPDGDYMRYEIVFT
jgi:hypothetical protein